MALTDTGIRQLKYDGSKNGLKRADGGGMYLHVTAAGKYWRMNYRYAGRQKTLALGVYPLVTLAEARKRRDDAKIALDTGRDPQDVKRAQKHALAKSALNTFEAIALEWHQTKARTWASVTSRKVLRHLEVDVFPMLGARPINEIRSSELLQVLKKVSDRSEYTAKRLREHCSQIFRYARGSERCEINPAADLVGMLPSPALKHRPALTTQAEFGHFVRDLEAYTQSYAVTKLAAKFAVLTWTRSREMRLARWEHIDLDRKEWRVPAIDMKMGKQLQAHIVPLSPQAIAVLDQLRPLTEASGRLFPGNHGADSVMSENTVNGLFKKLGYQNRQSHHGLRASARSLLSERGHSPAALERQLDHSEQNKVIAAYARSEHLAERRELMDDWGSFVEGLVEGGRGGQKGK
jgi:integrase